MDNSRTVEKIKYKKRRHGKTGLKQSKNLGRTDFYRLMKEQNGVCANKDCAKNNDGEKQEVGSISDMCFKTSIKIWHMKNRQGDPRKKSNRQLLCPTCKKIKKAENLKEYARLKKAAKEK